VSFFNVAHAGVRELQADLAKRMGTRDLAAKPAPTAEHRSAATSRAAAPDRWKGF
jgi:hypothetical protein